jgi:hypothetical protein
MARFTLTVTFNDPLADSDGSLYAELAASTALHALRHQTQIVVESAELVDSEAPTPAWGGGTDFHAWCLEDAADVEDEIMNQINPLGQW